LANAKFGPGKEESNAGGGKECIYGSQTTNVVTVEVAVAADAATAQADYSEEQAQAQTLIETKLPPGTVAKLNTTNTEGIGDRASTVTGTSAILGKPIYFTGIYVLKGPVFFLIGDLVVDAKPPTVAAIQDQAKVTLGRI
jgi:hypothetical protein